MKRFPPCSESRATLKPAAGYAWPYRGSGCCFRTSADHRNRIMQYDFRSDPRIVPVTTGRDRQGHMETGSPLPFRYATARRAESTKSEGQALRVSLVKPGAYLSMSYFDLLLQQNGRGCSDSALWSKPRNL